jgi:hypothetical protein
MGRIRTLVTNFPAIIGLSWWDFLTYPRNYPAVGTGVTFTDTARNPLIVVREHGGVTRTSCRP